ncbi:MAG: SRPBCC family protein [Bacteroidales bacterium]
MKALKWILLVILVLLVIIIGIGYIMPKEVKVTTSEEINVPPAKVFHFVAGFVDRTAWDPWIKSDTAAKCTFDIKAGYVGSKYSWEGPKVGKGMMVVDSVVPGSYLLNSVSFAKGSPIREEWTFTPTEKGTNLTWTITMSSGAPVGRIMNSMLKGIIQKTIDSGKADLKSYLETHEVKMSNLSETGIEEFPAVEALTCSREITMEEMPGMFGESMGKIFAAIQAQKIQPQGTPFAYYSDYDAATGKMNMTAGVPVSSGGKTAGDVVLAKYKAFTALKGLHSGPYEELRASYEALGKYAKENNIDLTQEMWEFYLNDPGTINDPTLLQTLIAMPVKK